MSRMTAAELMKVPGMEPKRVDGHPGRRDPARCEQREGAGSGREVHVTRYARGRRHSPRSKFASLPRSEWVAELDLFPLNIVAACRLGCQEGDLKQLVATAELLFDALRPLHRSWGTAGVTAY